MHFTQTNNISSSYWILCVSRDVMSLGITLVGHQKKIMSSIQTMRAQMLHLHGTGVQVWWTETSHQSRSGSGAAPRRNQDQRLMSTRLWCLTWFFFLREGLGSSLLRAATTGKGQNSTTKGNYLDETTSFFVCFSFHSFGGGVADPTTYQMAQYNLMI